MDRKSMPLLDKHTSFREFENVTRENERKELSLSLHGNAWKWWERRNAPLQKRTEKDKEKRKRTEPL